MADPDPAPPADPTADMNPSGESAARTLAAAASAAATLREGPGTRIGPYKILQLIGEGGFGSVFLAEQEQPVQRKVAIKIIKLGMDTRQVVARFEQERQALALMDHPNIARVLDAGATETGRPYFVMELVKGDPIVEYCDKNSLSVHERAELFAQVCGAVQHAHTKGIIHRDIKPSNVLVSMQDGKPSPKVIDFGVAKATASKLTEKTLFTEHRQMIGTPEYMSPEQAEGSMDIDTRTDIYSLGVLLYELLTGTTPFSGSKLHSAAYAEIQRIIREVDPPAPSTRLSRDTNTITGIAARRHTEPHKLGATIRGELDWIVMKALEKDRQRRYETASGLAMDIQRYLAGDAVLAAPPSAVYRFKKFVRRHRGSAMASAAVAAALLIGAVGFAWQAHMARDQRDRAVTAEGESNARAAELKAVAEFQAKMLSQINTTEAGEELMSGIRARFVAALEKTGASEAERSARLEEFGAGLSHVNATDTATEMIDRTILKPAITAIGTQFREQPTVDARLRHTLAELYRVLGLTNQAFPLAEQALAIRRRELGEEHPDTLESINELGTLLEDQGKFADAEKYYLEALEKRRRVLGEEDPGTITSLGNLGNFYRGQGRFAEAEPLLRSSLEASRRVRGESHRETFIAINCLGYLYVAQGKLAEAEPLWREAYEKGRRALGEDDPDVLVWINNLAGLLQGQGKLKEAEACYRESLEKHRRVRGEEHPATIVAIEVMGVTLAWQGRFAEAEQYYRESLDKSTRVLGKDHSTTLHTMNNLGNLLSRQGRLAEAETYLRQSLAGLQRTMGNDHPDTLVAMGQLAELQWHQEKVAEAEALYREAIERSQRVLGPEHPDTLARDINLGNLLVQAGRLDEAEPFIRNALATRRRISGEDHPETLVALSVFGGLLEAQGNLAEAESIDRRALEEFRRIMPVDHPNTLNAMWHLADVLRASGAAPEAEALYREALAGSERKYGKSHPTTASVRLSLGQALARQSRYADAERQLADAERVLTGAAAVSRTRKRECVHALVELYAAWEKAEPSNGHGASAALWQEKLDAAK